MHVVSLSGSPSLHSRSAWLLQHAAARIGSRAEAIQHIDLRQLPAQALLAGDARHPALRAAIEPLLAADVLLVATPIYKAAYSGLLKVFIDLLPPDALRHTSVLPLATGGSAGHFLALDYALKPVLSALGARHILDAVYALDSQLPRDDQGRYSLADELQQRLDRALAGLFEPVRRPAATVAVALPC